MEDRRRHRRMRMVSHLEVMFRDDGNRINAFTTNISEEGLGFCTGKEIRPHSDVEIKLCFDQLSEQQVSETIPCKIRWVKQISRIYEAGAQFLDVDLKNYPTLAQHIQHVTT